MNGIVFALILFCIVLLVVSLIYIVSTLKHKERLALLDKGKEPDFFNNDMYWLNSIKWGMILFGAGSGFFTAFLLNYYVFPGNDGEPIFPALILIGASLGLISFYFKFKRRDQ